MTNKIKYIDVNWLESFGNSKDYELLFMKSDEEPIFFAHHLEKVLHSNFHFLEEVMTDFEDDKVAFPLFFTKIKGNENAHVFILANRQLVSLPSSLRKDEPMLTLSFLDDDDVKDVLYLLGKNKKNKLPPLHKCDYEEFDYLVVIHSEKGMGASIKLLEKLQSSVFDKRRCAVATELMIRENTTRNTNVQQFLKNLFSNVEIDVQNYQNKVIQNFMNNVVQISPENYKTRRFAIRPTSPVDMVNNKLYHRKDY